MPGRRDSVGKASGLSVQVQESVTHTMTHRTAAKGRAEPVDVGLPYDCG